MKNWRWVTSGFIAAAFFLVDRLFKLYALHSLPPGGVFLIPGLLGLERYENRGAAFGLPLPQVLIVVAATAVILLLAKKILTAPRRQQSLTALVWLILGAGSNLYDRLTLGYVVDYLRLGPLSLVNLADLMIVVGLLLVLFQKPNIPAPKPDHWPAP